MFLSAEDVVESAGEMRPLGGNAVDNVRAVEARTPGGGRIVFRLGGITLLRCMMVAMNRSGD